MIKSKWISWGASLGLLCLLAMTAVLFTRCTPITRPTAPLTNVAVINQVKPPPTVIANRAVSTTRVLTATQAITHGDWLTFTDAEAGYSIRYPANFILRSGKSKGEMYSTTRIIFNLPNVRNQEMDIQVASNPNNLPVDAVVKAIYEDLTNKPLQAQAAVTLEEMTVAGMTAYKTTMLPESADFEILVPYNKKVYRLVLVYGLAGVESAPEAKASFFQMLSTFQIKKPE